MTSVTANEVAFLRRCMVEELEKRPIPQGLTLDDFTDLFDGLKNGIEGKDPRVVGFVLGGIYKYMEGKSGRSKTKNNW